MKNYIFWLLMLNFCLFSMGCERDKEDEINYPVTLTFEDLFSSGYMAYENQDGNIVEVNAAGYSQHEWLEDYKPADMDRFESITLISETEIELRDSSGVYPGTYTKVGTEYSISTDWNGQTLNMSFSGDENSLTIPGKTIFELGEFGPQFVIGGMCMAINEETLIPCGEIDPESYIPVSDGSFDNGDVLVFRTYSFRYKSD